MVCQSEIVGLRFLSVTRGEVGLALGNVLEERQCGLPGKDR